MPDIENNTEHDDSKWIWGIFYFNPQDKRIFPPKRIAWLGWTINFANPYSVLALVLLILVITGVNVLFLKNTP